jgi:glycosyltransferase involved in cell wall biosynthesis
MLARLPRGARLFVLDAESRDETVAVARAHGATVETRAWRGFVEARRYALARVATPWTLMLDADELLDERLREAIVRAKGDVDGYRLRRVTTLCGVPVRTAGWSDERLLRLFRTDRVRVVGNSVGGDAELHERCVCDGRVADLPGAIVHESYPTLASYRAKFVRYTSIEAASLRPSAAALARELAFFPLRVIWSIVRYRGWNDGWRGLFVAWESARYRIVVRAKALRNR